jgi:dTDP-4-amino-4,6-dideoxygalactose transaminase
VVKDSTKQIPFSSPDIQQGEIDAIAKVIRSGWLAEGQNTKAFEDLFCQYTGSPYAKAVSNCTAALHLSCIAAGCGPGEEVIVPAQTHVATAHAVEYTGAKPVFADVDSTTGNIDIQSVERCLTNRTRGVIPVHMAGIACDMDSLVRFCTEHDLFLIEDCAHGLGSRYKGQHVGTFGLAGCFSFYPTKQITTGEGGIVISSDSQTIELVGQLRGFGIDSSPNKRKIPGHYEVNSLGYNYRMTDFQAALGLGQLRRYNENLGKRQANARQYVEELTNSPKVEFPLFSEENSYFLFQAILNNNIDRDLVVVKLREFGIGTSVHYAKPVPLMKYYKDKYDLLEQNYSSAVKYGKQVISFPVHSNMTEEDVTYVCDHLKAIIG